MYFMSFPSVDLYLCLRGYKVKFKEFIQFIIFFYDIHIYLQIRQLRLQPHNTTDKNDIFYTAYTQNTRLERTKKPVVQLQAISNMT
ncbi:hypothetical protein SP90_15385 [Halodesulfovibrio spirochaetisodalis]|uniref:Uncharacterized protein n=1 Tax=Halodesulfovibrio spirochaetisodalis TaxID=1560234 RepID=A0A1B7X9A5_9BACT|nr:hypothetical protein SP90_15385 [Halodesulfovibrio spirochaetisodalis]